MTCRCADAARERYRAKLSGPLLDRIDLHVSVPPVEVSALVRPGGGESSQAVRERVLRARCLQRERARALGLRAQSNMALSSAELERVVSLDDAGRALLEGSVSTLGLSARAFGKVLRVARTVADLDGAAQVSERHIGEAIQGRVFDRDPR